MIDPTRSPSRFAMFIALTMLLTACSKSPVSAQSDEPIVEGSTIRFAAGSAMAKRLVTSPVVKAQEHKLTYPGRIVWDENHTSRITSPVAGRLEKILVQAGEVVKTGQPLAYLISSELGSAQADAVRAQAELAQAERNLKRLQELKTANGVAGKDLEQAQLDLERARVESERTQSRIKMLGANSVPDQRYIIRSPIDGVVVDRNANYGMEWRPDQPGAPLFVVSDPSYLWCVISAPEQALSVLRPGMNVILHASAWPKQTFKAQIDDIEDALDPVSRTVRVRAKLHNPGRYLKGEMYVTAELSSQKRGELDVPAKAVFLNSESHQVFVKIAEGQFVRKSISPVASNELWVSIEQGLKQGDEVVVDGALYLQKLLDDNAGKPLQKAAPQPMPSGGK